MKTYSPKPQDIQRDWIVIDAEDKILGRLATEVARRLRGKHRPDFTPHADTGDFVVIINAEKIKVTGNKLNDKNYYRHSGYPGGITATPMKDMMRKKPEQIIINAVKGMLPKNRLGKNLLKKLKVYNGPAHPHQSQQPQVVEL